MANPFNLDESAARLEAAAKNNDGLTAARIMDEAGSCNWKSLVEKASKIANAEEHNPFTLSTSDELLLHSEWVSLYKLGGSKNRYEELDNRVYPLAKVIDQRCEKK
jgi:hypothetical protein